MFCFVGFLSNVVSSHEPISHQSPYTCENFYAKELKPFNLPTLVELLFYPVAFLELDDPELYSPFPWSSIIN